VKSPELINVRVKLMEVIVGDDDWPVGRRKRDDRVHLDRIEVLMEIKRPTSVITLIQQ
jgi:hypothetical protein